MLDLSLDTSTDRYLIVLSEKKTILASIDTPHDHNLSQSLVPSIENILKANFKTVKDISRIFIGIGPGSYTGTRIAVSVAEGLSLALNIPLYSFCSLLAFIPDNTEDGSFTFLFDSKHSSHFLLKGQIKNKKITAPLEQILVEEKDIFEHLKANTLISFNPDGLNPSLLKETKKDTFLSKACPNLPLLIDYVNNHSAELPPRPQIIYLHTF